MERLNSKKKIAVFISGRGSNLKNLIRHSKTKRSLFKITLVLSNKSNEYDHFRSRPKSVNPINAKKRLTYEDN